MHNHTNRLIKETSPYLLQHAHNPVDWYPWGEEALNRAKDENKPILVSIGYAACHWCHVMERESFEDEQTAAYMNEHFVNIKVDREERPDIDHIYMDAVQAMSGSGGWPLNVFLTPDAKPFYGGTYFPPKPAFNRNSWQQVLQSVKEAFIDRRHEVDAQATNLTAHLEQSNAFGLQQAKVTDGLFQQGKLGEAFAAVMKAADKEWGGFGRAPKFPQTFTIQFLLRYYYVTGDEAALNQATLSLDKMIEGGIYDQVGGGFSRYSTDTEWLAPHFEKMLYDNALLVSVLSEAYQATKRERYREVIAETIAFIQNELTDERHGFYAALDADSEGEEGKFYVWRLDEVQSLLGEDSHWFCRYYDITEEGNWEGKNILRVKKPLEAFAAGNGIPVENLRQIVEKGRRVLLAERNKRVRPQLDDKVLLGWNALMNTACSKAYMATGEVAYRQMAEANMAFLLQEMRAGEGSVFRHTWKNGQAKYPAFLDDYACLIEALLYLQEITADRRWIREAVKLAEHVVEHFSDEEGVFFYYTTREQGDVIVRKKEIYDGAMPSGNSVMAYALYHLSVLADRGDWRERSLNMAGAVGVAACKYPVSFGVWASLLQEMVSGVMEVAIVGKEHDRMRAAFFDLYVPQRVLMSAQNDENEYPLLAGRMVSEKTMIYLCKDFVCQQPVETIERFMSLINSAKNVN